MEYTQIRVSSKDDSKRLNRLIAVRGNPNLLELGAIIGSSFNVWFEHCYLFKKHKEKTFYVIDSWVEDDIFGYDVSMTESYLSDLDDSFTYEYDTGEGYEFDCKIFKRKLVHIEDKDEEEYPLAFVVKGVGQGIFENDHGTFWMYLDGDISPESTGDEENDIYLPMNMDFEKFGDFDKPLDLSEYIYYQDDIDSVIYQYL